MTNEQLQAAIATDRCSQFSSHCIYWGDAVDDNNKWILLSEKKNLQINNFINFDYIISVDSAYHYTTRWKFFEKSIQYLKTNGTIILTDIVAGPSILKKDNNIIIKFVIYILEKCFPKTNFVSIDDYKSILSSTEIIENNCKSFYENIEVEDISEKVFPGFFYFVVFFLTLYF